MLVKELHAANFKTFHRLSLHNVNRFSVLVGANASGKSNFIQIFRFLRDISRHGLRNAVSLQGGIEYLRNTKTKSKEISIRVVYDPDIEITRARSSSSSLTIRYVQYDYHFVLEITGKGRGYKVKKDILSKEIEFCPAARGKKQSVVRGRSIVSNSGGTISYSLQVPEGIDLKESEVMPAFLSEEKLSPDSLLLESSFFAFIHRFEDLFKKIAIYDFDPKLPKRSVATMGRTELEENGSNIAIVLRDILEDRESKRKFMNLMKDLLPFFEDLEVEKLTDKSLLLKLRELYSGETFMPAPFISDGTINLINILVALYFEDKSLIIFEEPERNIHPPLIAKLVEMMKEAARKKQVLVTTHNTEIVKSAGPSDIYLVYREESGFSAMVRPYEKEEIRTFLENDLKIEDLYSKDLLGI